MTAELVTERLRLRAFTTNDLELLVALDADPGVKRYIDGGLPVDRAEVAEMLDWWLGFPERSPGHGFWAAIDLVTDRFVGWFHLRPNDDDPSDRPELGYRLHRAVWGQGLATEGSLELVRHAFVDLGAQLVYAETMAVNLASRRVMEHVGMRHVRTFHADWPVRVDGDEQGDVRYEITRAAWSASPPSGGRIRPSAGT